MSKTVMLLSTVPDERPEAALKTAADLGYRTIMCAEEPDAQQVVPHAVGRKTFI